MQTTLLNTPVRRRHRSRWSAWHVLELLLLMAGFAGLGVWVYSFGAEAVSQRYGQYELDAMQEGRVPSFWGFVLDSAGIKGREQATSEADDDAYKALASPQSTPGSPRVLPADSLIGRLEIPRVKVTAIVREGVDSSTLQKAAGHVPGTALPGEPGSVAVAAHRDTLFRGLRNLRISDQISITTPEKTVSYRVKSTEIVNPEDVEVLRPRSERELTLITCYPFQYVGHAPKRFIVKAEQIDETGTEQAVFGPAGSSGAPETGDRVREDTSPMRRRPSAHKART